VIRGVDASWLQDRLGEDGLTVFDPRSRIRYLSGHVSGALSVPTQDAFAADGRLLSDDELASWLGHCGVATEGTVVLYADADGQSGAMLAWILAYLGHPDVRVLTTRFEHWDDEGGELFYRSAATAPTIFVAKPKPEFRATRAVAASGRVRLLDTRTPEEFTGEKVIGDDPPGHIPGATNLSHQSFLGDGHDLLASKEEIAARLADVDLDLDEPIVTYCRSGLRASVAWLALHLAGAPVTLYDGSFLDWTREADAVVSGVVPIQGG
jgi:thiosulfate/3-mercaptopyruvate sulfurtransferase